MICCLCDGKIKPERQPTDSETMTLQGEWSGGHNPYPIVHKKGDRCCWECNQEIVCVARLAIYMRHQKQLERGETKNGKVRRDELPN